MSTISGDGTSPSGPALPESQLPQPPLPGPPRGPVMFPGPDVPRGQSPFFSAPPKRRGKLRVLIGVIALTLAGIGVLVSVLGNGKDGGAGRSASGDPAAPTGLRVAEQGGLDVSISWEVGASGASAHNWVVFRDGKKVGKLPSGRTEFTDKGLIPGKTYRYTVAAFAGGTLSPQSDPVSVSIPAMDLADARFGGSWTLTVRYTEAHGYSNVHAGGRDTHYWSFAPVCNEGACDSKLRDSLSGPPWNLVLRRSGAVYAATSTEQMSTCNASPVMGNVTVRIRVTRAAVVDDRWRATRIVGTVVGSEGSKSVGIWYCPASGFSASITGGLNR